MKQFPALAPDPELRSRAGWACDPGGWIAAAAVITLMLAFGGVQARWHLPVYGAIFCFLPEVSATMVMLTPVCCIRAGISVVRDVKLS